MSDAPTAANEPGLLSSMPIRLPADQGIGVLTCIPSSRKLLPLEMVISMACQSAPTHMTTGYLGVKNLPIDQARERACETAQNVGAKYLWFIDDDTVPPPNSLKRMIYILDNYPDVGIVGGVYVTRDPVQPQPVIFRGMGMGSYWSWKAGDIFEVTGMGAGCMLVRVSILKELPRPWFKFDINDSNDPLVASTSVSEDIWFCNLVRKAGHKIFAHGGILCDHWDVNTGEVFRMPPDSYPMRPREVQNPPADESQSDANKKE
jgi:hypothetical protein